MKIKYTKQSSDANTIKYVQETSDDHFIETTFVSRKEKYIICISTQIGCNLGCRFCYNGLLHNFIRNLTDKEIITQVENVYLHEKLDHNKSLLISAMGIGEPLLNCDNLITAFKYLNSAYVNSKFAIATTGVNLNGIMQIGKALKELRSVKLTISLHCAIQSKRQKLMPSCLDTLQLIKTVDIYEKLFNRSVEWNVVLLKEFNDFKSDAIALCDLLGADKYVKINRYNPVDLCTYEASNNITEFMNILKEHNLQAEYYETNGSDINAACGQLICG